MLSKIFAIMLFMTVNYTTNQVIQFQDELYCFHNNQLYQKTCDWNVIPLNDLPDQLTVSNGGIYITDKKPDRSGFLSLEGGSGGATGAGGSVSIVGGSGTATGAGGSVSIVGGSATGARDFITIGNVGGASTSGGDFTAGDGIRELFYDASAGTLRIMSGDDYFKPQTGNDLPGPLEEEQNECSCPMQMLMASGCQCGGS